MAWSLSLLLGAIGLTMLIGLGPSIYRAAVCRTGDQEVLCRFIPWYQSTHLSSLMFPVIGLAAIAQGREPDSPGWVGIFGVLIVIIGILFVISALLAWFANRLVITPSALSIRIIFRKELVIPRERVGGVAGRARKNGATGAPRVHVDLTYSPVGTGGATESVPQLEGQFTVEPPNLVAALQAWQDGDPNDIGLMDRVEKLLRGHPTP